MRIGEYAKKDVEVLLGEGEEEEGYGAAATQRLGDGVVEEEGYGAAAAQRLGDGVDMG